MSLLLSGIGVSRGIAIGKAHLMRGSVEVVESAIPTHLLDDEIKWVETIGPLFRGLESFPVEFAARA